MNVQRVCLLIILVSISTCSGHIGGRASTLQDVGGQFYCGRKLAMALSLLCYNEEDVVKRSHSATMYDTILQPYYREQETGVHMNWPWIVPHKAKSQGFGSRDKRYIVNECCDKSCTTSELVSYC